MESPQGSVLGPTFLDYIYDQPEGITSHVNMFADDTELMEETNDAKDCETLLGDLDALARARLSARRNLTKVLSTKYVKWIRTTSVELLAIWGAQRKQTKRSWDTDVKHYHLIRHIRENVGAVYVLLENNIASRFINGDTFKKIFITYVKPEPAYGVSV